MASSAFSAHGTTVKWGDGATPTEHFTVVAELRDIDGPGFTRSEIDVTNQQSTWREFISGLKDGGQITFAMAFLPQDATQSYTSGVLKDFVSGVKRNIQLAFTDPGNTVWTAPIIVKDFKVAAKLDDALMANVTVRIAGAPTLA